MESETRTVGGRPVAEKGRRPGNWGSLLARFLQLAAACCAFPVMLRASQGAVIYSDFQAFSFLVAGTVIAAAWALLALLMDLVLLCMGRIIHSPTFLFLIVLGDFVAMFMALGAGSAAAGITTMNDMGLPGRPFMCSGSTPFNSFCARSKAATAMAIISAAFFVPSLALDSASLGREMYEEAETDRARGPAREV